MTTRSTKKFAAHEQVKQLQHDFPDHVIAIGGGAIIDKAKLYCKRTKKKLIAIPTTGAGASATEWAVIWQKGGRKCSSRCETPMTILPRFEVTLRKKDRENTIEDVYTHLYEASISEKNKADRVLCDTLADLFYNIADRLSDNEIIQFGFIGGMIISKYGTNIIHALSYPLTGIYGVPHGRALKYVTEGLPRRFTPVDKDVIIKEALTYEKIHKSVFGNMTEERLGGMLK